MENNKNKTKANQQCQILWSVTLGWHEEMKVSTENAQSSLTINHSISKKNPVCNLWLLALEEDTIQHQL